MTIIEQLEDADKTLAADGYKDYSYVRIAISEAIRALRQPPVIGSVCDGCGSKFDDMDISVGVCYCCQKEIKQTDL